MKNQYRVVRILRIAADDVLFDTATEAILAAAAKGRADGNQYAIAHVDVSLDEPLTGNDEVQEAVAQRVVQYEANARSNRPDWDQFILDAKQDRWGIACEMQEMEDSPLLQTDEGFDALYGAACDWVDAL